MFSKFLLCVPILFTQQLSAQITSYTVCADDYCDGYALENVSLGLTLATSPVIALQYEFTGVNGCATFNTTAIPVDSVVTILADGNLDPLNGINTNDLLVFQKHLTGEQPFTEIYQWIAADVNLDKVVDSTDYTILRNLVLGTYTELPKGQFRFFPKTFVFAHPATPLVDSLPEKVLEFVNGAPADLDLWAVQLGKVNRTGCLAYSSVEQLETPLPVNTFPNPANETLHIQVGGVLSLKTYTLTNILGKRLYVSCTDGADIHIPVVSLPKGMYNLSIRENNRLVYNGKVIIAR